MENNMNNVVTNGKKRTELTFALLWDVLKKFAICIAVITVLVGCVGGAYVKLFTRTRYSASSKFNVINVLSSNEYVDPNMLNAAALIATNCVDIIREDRVIATAVDTHRLDQKLGVDRETAIKNVGTMVRADQFSNDSPIFTVTVTTDDMQLTYDVISAIQDVLPGVVENMWTTTDTSKIAIKLAPLAEVETVNDVREVRKSAVKYALIGMAGAFVVSYAIALFLYINDTKVYDDTTIKAHFDSPVLGIIPEWGIENEDKRSKHKRRRGSADSDRDYTGKLLCSQTPFAVSEAFNTLRTNLCYSTAAEQCPVFAVTSDFSGSGKSVISANIALSLSILGKRTLLIECDLRRPELGKIFSCNVDRGMSEILSGNAASVEEVIYRYDKNLDIIFSGRIPPNPSELLGSEIMRDLIASCKEKYDFIIIDTPPVFEVSDVGVISYLITGTVMVARSNYSDVDAITASEELIRGLNGRIIGYVVNDVDLKAGSSYYYRKSKRGYRKYYKYAKYYTPYTSSNNGDKSAE